MDLQTTASSAWRLETETALAELDEARANALKAHKEALLAVEEFEKKRKAYLKLIECLEVPRIGLTVFPGKATIREKTATGRGGKTGPRNGQARVLAAIARQPGIELPAIHEATGIGKAYLSGALLPKLVTLGFAINNLGRWTLTDSGRARLAD